MEQDSSAISMIIMTLSPDALTLVVGCLTSMEVWLTLKLRYASTSELHIMKLKSTLQSIQKGSDCIEKYLLKFKSARDQLASVGVTISDQDVKGLILAGLPIEYGPTRQIIRGKNDIEMEEVRCLLLSAEYEIELKHNALSLSSLAAMIAQNSLANSSPTYMMNNASASNTSGFLSSQFSQQSSCFAQPTGFIAQNGESVQLPYDGYGNGGLQHNGAFNLRGFQQTASVQQKHNFQPNRGLMQQHDFSYQNFSPHVSYTNSENYSQQSYSDNNGKNSFSRPHISNNKSYKTGQSYSGSIVCQICEKPSTFMQQNVNCVGMQVLYGGPQVQGYSQIPVTREDDNGSETNIENTQNVSQDEYVSTSKEKQEEVVSKEVSKEKVESERENGDEGNQPEKFMEESFDEKDTFPFELCLPDENSLITVVDYKDMVQRNPVKADGVSLSAAVDSSSKPMDSKIGIQDANSSQVYKSEAINDVSDKSSSSSMHYVYKPHKVNDVRWEAIQAVRDHDGMLGLNHFKLLNSKHNTQGVGLSHLKNKKVDSSATTSICSCSRAGSEEKENSDLNKDAAENKAFIPPYSIPSKWQQAILKEIDTLLIQGTWQLPCTSLERSLLNCRQACRPMKLWQLPLISPG